MSKLIAAAARTLWSAPTAEVITRLLLCSALLTTLCLLVGIWAVSKRDLP